MNIPRIIYLQDEGSWCTEQIHETDVEYIRKDIADELLTALKMVEWGFTFGNKQLTCPLCRKYQSDGHADICALRTALAKAERMKG